MNERLFHLPTDPKPSDDVLTPKWVFGALDITFDTDPCSSISGDHVPATTKYTYEHDGLTQAWDGSVWMNPPFSNPAPWIQRFIEHGNGICITVVSRAYWCLELWGVADFVAFPVKPFGFTSSGFLYPVMFAGYGKRHEEAIRAIAVPRGLS